MRTLASAHRMWNSLLLASIGPSSGSSLRTDVGGPDLTRYLLVCALLVLLVGGMAFAFRRLVAGTVRARAAKRSLQVLDMMPLGGKQRVCVVRCYDRTFALGLGDKEVALIAELDPVVGESTVQATGALRTPFAAFLRREETAPASHDAPAAPRVPFKSGGVFG